VGHVTAPEQGDGVQSRGACGSTEAFLNKEVGSDAVGHMTVPLLSRKAGSGAVGHVAALEPSQVGRPDPKL
jgi:hypothetical protein